MLFFSWFCFFFVVLFQQASIVLHGRLLGCSTLSKLPKKSNGVGREVRALTALFVDGIAL